MRFQVSNRSIGCFLTFNKQDEFEIVGYSDSDYNSDLDRSFSLYFSSWENIVSWRATMQSVVALSTT